MRDFIRGIGSVLNLFPTARKVSLTPTNMDEDDEVSAKADAEADAEAIRKIWEQVGADIQFAIDNIQGGLESHGEIKK